MSFASDMQAFIKKTGGNADKAVRAVCLEVSKDIILATPVDTGRARGNWQANIGSPDLSVNESTDKSGAGSIAKAEATSVNSPGNIYYLTNNLPYIRTLEYGLYGTGPGVTDKTKGTGFSIQAPSGMVRVAIARLRAGIREAISRV